jgi:hypothetical protein
MWPMWSMVPGEDSSTGNVMGGRKLARYVLEAVVGRCVGCLRPIISRRRGGGSLPMHNRPTDEGNAQAKMSHGRQSRAT